MLVSGWVLLGLEESIKIPEGALHKVVCGHLCEPGSLRCHWEGSEGGGGEQLRPPPSTQPPFLSVSPPAHPISRKIWRSCERTLSRGCRWPQAGGSPSAEKL